jgi:hypothetical protein
MICNVDTESTATNFQHLSRLTCLVIDITCVLECIGWD